jgi:hypothetical protein
MGHGTCISSSKLFNPPDGPWLYGNSYLSLEILEIEPDIVVGWDFWMSLLGKWIEKLLSVGR